MLSPAVRRKRILLHRSSTTVFSRPLSSQQVVTNAPKQVSPHIGFYKVFGRPIAKVLLMATFTYQLSYWLWVKLEKDEIRSTREADISTLEAKLQEVVTNVKSP